MFELNPLPDLLFEAFLQAIRINLRIINLFLGGNIQFFLFDGELVRVFTLEVCFGDVGLDLVFLGHLRQLELFVG